MEEIPNDNKNVCIPAKLDTPLTRKVFQKALEVNLMEIDNGHYKWNGTKVQLAYMCGRIYCGDKPKYDEREEKSYWRFGWTEGLRDPGFHQMQHLKRLMLSFPYFERLPDQSVIVGNGRQYDRLISTRGNAYLLVYNYTSRDMTIDLRKISGRKKRVWWMDAATGQLTSLGEYDSKVITFRPHKTRDGIEDGVLIAVDEAMPVSF